MTTQDTPYTGRWLHDTDQRGKDFSHSSQDYEHTDDASSDPVKMRHAVVRQGERQVKVWAPADWTEDQITEALESNW